jgi:hypothetical protein
MKAPKLEIRVVKQEAGGKRKKEEEVFLQI